MTEYEVLKRHDVYVVRKVGSSVYAVWRAEFAMGEIIGWCGLGDADSAYPFSLKWSAILHAMKLEREDRATEKARKTYEARKSATEERVWR